MTLIKIKICKDLMPTPPPQQPAAVEKAIRRLGQNIRTARTRRKLRQIDLARRIGISRFALAELERGKPTSSIGLYFSALWALNLLNEAENLGAPERDEEGSILERSREPQRVYPKRTVDNDF